MNLKPATSVDYDKIYSELWNQNDFFFTWGIDGLDVPMPLITERQLGVMSGAEASGKTTWSLEMAKANANLGKEKGFTVGYLSLEMNPWRIAKRYVERQLDITKEQRRTGTLFIVPELETMQQLSRDYVRSFFDSGLLMFPETEDALASLSALENIEAICRDNKTMRLLFIDNLLEIQAENMRDEYQRYDYILQTLSRLAKETSTTIVLLHHLAKPKENTAVTANSIKGNNIIITKPDIVVCVDKHLTPNFNWYCQQLSSDGEFVDSAVMNKFYAAAPKIEVRAIEVFKDRDYDMRGCKGYLRLEKGKLFADSREYLKEIFPLSFEDQTRMAAALTRFKLTQ